MHNNHWGSGCVDTKSGGIGSTDQIWSRQIDHRVYWGTMEPLEPPGHSLLAGHWIIEHLLLQMYQK